VKLHPRKKAVRLAVAADMAAARGGSSYVISNALGDVVGGGSIAGKLAKAAEHWARRAARRGKRVRTRRVR